MTKRRSTEKSAEFASALKDRSTLPKKKLKELERRTCCRRGWGSAFDHFCQLSTAVQRELGGDKDWLNQDEDGDEDEDGDKDEDEPVADERVQGRRWQRRPSPKSAAAILAFERQTFWSKCLPQCTLKPGRSRVRVRIRTSFILYYLASVCSGQFPLWSLVLTSSKLQPPKSFQKLQLQQSEHHHSDWDKLNTEHTIQNNQLSQVDKMRKLYLI